MQVTRVPNLKENTGGNHNKYASTNGKMNFELFKTK